MVKLITMIDVYFQSPGGLFLASRSGSGERVVSRNGRDGREWHWREQPIRLEDGEAPIVVDAPEGCRWYVRWQDPNGNGFIDNNMGVSEAVGSQPSPTLAPPPNVVPPQGAAPWTNIPVTAGASGYSTTMSSTTILGGRTVYWTPNFPIQYDSTPAIPTPNE